MRKIYMREPEAGRYELVVHDEEGQAGEPISLTASQLLDLNAGMAPMVASAWLFIKKNKP